MYAPRRLEEIRDEADLFWIYLRGQWRMASIVWHMGAPSYVSIAPGLFIDTWQKCRDLLAIPVAA